MLSIPACYPCLSLPPPPLRARFCALRLARFALSASASRRSFAGFGVVGGFGGLLRSGIAASLAQPAALVQNTPRLQSARCVIAVEDGVRSD
jgi:hypothetical protein